MVKKKGIDVSEFQGTIDWGTVIDDIDFAILRAGYGSNNIDEMFHKNADACTKLGIPFGMYWFSYAYTKEMAIAEADYICDLADKYLPTYPICYDFEDSSEVYANRNGVTVNKELLITLASAFLNRVEERGYYACNYTNLSYLSRGFSELTDKYDTWLAAWSYDEPPVKCGMFQYSGSSCVDGIDGIVDCNYAYKDYPAIIADMSEPEVPEKPADKSEELKKVYAETINRYLQLAGEIILGKYGNGDERKQAILDKGYDYDFVQEIVTVLLS